MMRPLSTLWMLVYSMGSLGANAVYGLANLAFPLLLGSYAGVPNWVVGLLAQERSFVGGFVQPAVGWLSDHLPDSRLGRRRPFFLVGVPLTAAGLALLASHPPLPVVIGLLTVFSFFLAVAYDPYLALLADIVPSEERGRVGGVMAATGMIGTVIVIALSFLLWEQHEPWVFIGVALLLVVTFGITFAGIREPSRAERVVDQPVDVPNSPEPVAWGPLGIYLLATFSFWLGNGGIVPFITRFGVDVLHVAENQSFLLILPAIVGAVIFAIPSGLLAERFSKKRVLVAGQLLFGLAGLAGAFLVQDVLGAVIVMSLVGVANAATTALTFPLLTDLIPRSRAATFTGIGQMVWSLAQPIGAVTAGIMADQTGTLRGAFAAGGTAMLLAGLIVVLVRVPPAAPAVPKLALAAAS